MSTCLRRAISMRCCCIVALSPLSSIHQFYSYHFQSNNIRSIKRAMNTSSSLFSNSTCNNNNNNDYYLSSHSSIPSCESTSTTTTTTTTRIQQIPSLHLRRFHSFHGSIIIISPCIRHAGTRGFNNQESGSTQGGKDIDIIDEMKPVHIRVAEQRDSQIYSMHEYIERDAAEEAKSITERISEVRDNPAWMLWALLFLSAAVGTVVVSLRVRREQMRFDPRLRAVKQFDSDTGPSIGGPFSLLGVDGRRYTDDDFKGKWMYIYFGFTNCPDICPEEMAKMSRVIQHLDKKVGKEYWQPIFISLDPRRDTPEKIKEYLSDFNPRILGLVGTQEEVEAAAREYRVYFAIPDEEEAAAAASSEDYLVDHSIIMYLIDPDGKFSDYTTKEFQWFESYSKLLRRMMDYERAKAQRQKSEGGLIQNGESAANMKVANIATVMDEDIAGKIPTREEAERNKPQQMMTVRR